MFPYAPAGGLHEYKLRFGYEMVPHRSAIQLHPVLDAFLNGRVARAAVRVVRRLRHEQRQLDAVQTVLEGAHASGPPTSGSRLA